MSFGSTGHRFLAAEYRALWLPVNTLVFLGQAYLALFCCLFPTGGSRRAGPAL